MSTTEIKRRSLVVLQFSSNLSIKEIKLSRKAEYFYVGLQIILNFLKWKLLENQMRLVRYRASNFA